MTTFVQHSVDSAPAESKPVLQAGAQAYGFEPSVEVPDSAVQALRHSRSISGNPRLQALDTFAEALLRDLGYAGAPVRAAFMAAGFTRQIALEVVTIVAAKVLSNYANVLARTLPDP